MTRLQDLGLQVWSQGAPVAGAQVFFYQNLTTTPADVYLDAAREVPAPNPMTADENGHVDPYLDPAQTYTLVLRTAGGVTIRTFDNVTASGSGGGGIGVDGASQFTVYNDSPREIVPPDPTGDGSNDGWYFPPNDGANWLSVKRGTDINVGDWSEPVLFTGKPGTNGSLGGQTLFIWTRANVQPDTPSGPNPTGWSSRPSLAPGDGKLWQSVGFFDGAGNQIGTWDVPQQVEGEDGLGEDGDPGLSPSFIFIESADRPATPVGLNPAGWSDGPPPNNTDPIWQSYGIKTADGNTLVQPWSVPYQITGDVGPAGNQTVSRWRRSIAQPSTPSGDDPPGWSSEPDTAEGSGFLWQSNALFSSGGQIQGAWGTPFRIEGESGSVNIFRRAATAPARPLQPDLWPVIPTGWSDAPPANDGNPLWQSNARFTVDGTILGDGWSVPERVTGEVGSTYVQLYRRAAAQPQTPSGDNPSGWSTSADLSGSGVIWMISAYRDAAGVLIGSWSEPAQISGENGANGPYFDFRYRRSTSTPAAPSNVPEPSGWSDAPPSGSNPLWQIIARKDGGGALLTNWSAPERVSAVDSISAFIDVPAISLQNDLSIDYSPATGQWTVLSGGLDVTASSTFAEVSEQNCSGQVNNSTNQLFTGAKGAYRITNIPDPSQVAKYKMRATYNGQSIEATFSITVVGQPQSVSVAPSGINNVNNNGTNIAIGGITCFAQNIMNPVFNWVKVSGSTQITNENDPSNPAARFISSGTNTFRSATYRCDVTADGGAGTTYSGPNVPILVQHGDPQ